MQKLYVLFLVSLLYICLLRRDFFCNGDTNTPKCLESDRKALVAFKNGLEDPDNVLSSWRGNGCCVWSGVQCDNNTGAVIALDLHGNSPTGNLTGEIDHALMRLQSMRYLDLSLNMFQSIPIPEFLGSLENLEYLNLSHAGFSGLVPHSLGNISRLKYLDVSSELFSGLTADTLRWLGGLSSLQYVGMNTVDLSVLGDSSLQIFDKLSFLTELHLSGCHLSVSLPSLCASNLTALSVVDLSFNQFDSKFPDWIVNMSSLVSLDLSHGGLYGNIPYGISDLPKVRYLNLAGSKNLTADCSVLFSGSWRNIQVIKLADNSLHGYLPSSVGNMTSLVDLDLFANKLEGGIPSSIGSLCKLKTLDLSGNILNGKLPIILTRSNTCTLASSLPSLISLNLSVNRLAGNLPDWLGELHNLVHLRLDYNLFQGIIPASIGRLPLLSVIGLAGNKLSGSLPETFGQLSNLGFLDISSNQLSGTVSETHFSMLKKLKNLQISSNYFVLNFNSNWVPPFQVGNLGMRSCDIGPFFPTWLKTQKEVMYLDLSNASISGTIPSWFWNMSSNLFLLNVSFNQLEGEIPNPLNIAPFADVDFSSNLFEGPIPLPTVEIELFYLSNNRFSESIPSNIGQMLPNLIFLALSNNQLTGPIPTSIGGMLGLEVLDLSQNNLTSEIPSSLQYCSYLKVLDLKYNDLTGAVPSSLGQLRQLKTLHLSNNRLSGELPSSLQNCLSLETLDLGNNKFYGPIPVWIGESLSSLKILRLGSNAFSGIPPSQLTTLIYLQVLDLAQNNLIGSIPTSLASLKAMVRIQNEIRYSFYGFYRGVYYEENAVLNTKGHPHKYTKLLSLVTSLDLSGNDFVGDIPEALPKLRGLVVLNLSGNHLTGKIPNKIDDLKQLSSLDVSSNQLSGSIPFSMSSMSFLSYLNFSNNDFSGMIPFTGQMTTFNSSTFYGNPRLCGPPLTTKCQPNDTHNRDTINKDDPGKEYVDKWIYLCIGLGFAMGILVPFVVLAIKKRWADAYFGFIDKLVGILLCR